MRVLVQCCKTLRFLGPEGAWTDSPTEAVAFANSAVAVNHVIKTNLDDVQVVLKFPNAGMDVTLPVLGATSCREGAPTKL